MSLALAIALAYGLGAATGAVAMAIALLHRTSPSRPRAAPKTFTGDVVTTAFRGKFH